MSEYRKLDGATERLFESVIAKIDRTLQVIRKSPEVGLRLLAPFDEPKRYDSLFVHHVTEVKGKRQSFVILLLEKHSTIIEQKRHSRMAKEIEEVEPMLIFDVPHEMGRVFVRQETMGDKIADVFLKIDIDFVEYPDFSSRYLVVGENPELVRKHLPKNLMESLSQTSGMVVEINEKKGLLRPEKNLTEELLLTLISIGSGISG